jgi:lysophospholipase L1-like esterase
MDRLRIVRKLGIVAGFSAFALSSCGDETTQPTVDPIFARYVAMGNSLTAGFESGGINDSTQASAYPVLLAQQMGLTVGTDFGVPSLSKPGCAPPIVNIFTLQRVDGGASTDCGGRTDATATVHNLAIPGAQVIDVISTTDPRANPNSYTTLFLDGSSQIDVAETLAPTFVTVWIGNNDIFGAARSGDATGITPQDTFAQDFEQLAQRIEDMGVQGALFIGVGKVENIPFFSAGAAYWVGFQMGAFPPTFTVSPSCDFTAAGGAGETTLVPFEYGFGVLLAQAAQGMAVTLDCATDSNLLNILEITQIVGAVARYNTVIEREALARGWAYLDPNPVLDSLRTAGEVPLFPNTSGAEALFTPFGTYFSRDGFHISAATQALLADHSIDVINATFGESLAKP